MYETGENVLNCYSLVMCALFLKNDVAACRTVAESNSIKLNGCCNHICGPPVGPTVLGIHS